MSGGHWNYMQHRLNDKAREAGAVWLLMAELEHQLDWGICGDTCIGCAKARCAEALVAFFDAGCENASRALSIARDYKQNECARCAPPREGDGA